jgi:TonB family protein
VSGDLLGAIPFGGVLSGLWRVLLAADRREEFVGDLVEQAREDLSGRAPVEISLWLLGQTLHSAPSLLVARARRLARRQAGFSGGGARQVASGVPGMMFGYRGEQRSWSLPMAVSVSAHAVAVFTLFIFTVGQIEEIEAPWVRVALEKALAPSVPSMTLASAAPTPPAPRRARKQRVARAVNIEPQVVQTPLLMAEPLQIPIEDPEVRNVVVVVPPAVAEKRCLSCPAPKLPPAYVRLGARQQVVVKTCVGSKGDVTSVDVLRGLGAQADAGVVDTVRGWRFEPHTVGDHPVPFCYPTRFLFSMN